MSDFQSRTAFLPVVTPAEGVKRAKGPVQERSLARISRAISVTERLLVEVGPEKVSIPEIAKLADVPRATIYQYFPDKHALFAHIANQHMQAVLQLLSDRSDSLRSMPWRELVAAAISGVAEYYNEKKVAGVLLLGGAFSPSNIHVHQAKNQASGKLLRAQFDREVGGKGLPKTPDAATIAVEIADAILRRGYLDEGYISEAICVEAQRAVVAYLALHEPHP